MVWTTAAAEAGSDEPITEAIMAPPKTSDPAKSVRKYLPNPEVMNQHPPLLGCPFSTPAFLKA
jgi:hypothetical protein